VKGSTRSAPAQGQHQSRRPCADDQNVGVARRRCIHRSRAAASHGVQQICGGAIALARGGFEVLAVDDRDMAAVILDQAGLLKRAPRRSPQLTMCRPIAMLGNRTQTSSSRT
jgi:hypothetical protein